MTDSLIMLRRNLKHSIRYPSLPISSIAVPVLMLLLFVGVFGSTLTAGLNGTDYIDYVTPGIIVLTVASGSISTAVSVSLDMTQGIMNRFRTMAISRAAVMSGHVVGGVIQTMLSIVLVVVVAVLLGFRPNAGLVEWLSAAGILVLMAFALAWLAAGIGLTARGPESASNLPLPFTFLPMLGSGFVPTDSLPGWLRWFAEYQPFTPINETLRGLLMGTPTDDAPIAVVWCVGLTAVGYLWSRRAFTKRTTR
ncbi:ABC transporter permease [Kibdelosporangium aridum]|uniref:Transport permease protein n=1 Tax=Kibdelosporangium aridum TaxID=2030 RepID=A0A1Y5Y5F1_KIBAR|nr:ABC transporter permease [Kibdelosporangium aridum]SMD26064.1 ABC-2 type transport system permease protein [Kibdelosporangium aridum]